MTERTIGRFRIKIAYRDLSEDRGLAIHVFGPTQSSSDEEVLRFDCFEQQPHYHLAWSYRDDPFILIESSSPFKWAIDKLAADMQQLLREAYALPMSADELAALKDLLPTIQSDGEALADAA